MSIVKILIPKKTSINLRKAKVENKMTIPIIALEILPLALSSAVLSPPDDIQPMAPKSIIKKKMITPMTNKRPIKLGIITLKKEEGSLVERADFRYGPKSGFSTGFTPPANILFNIKYILVILIRS